MNKVYAWQSDRNIVAIDCTAVENVEADNLYQRSELDYLIWNDPTAYADLILNGDPRKIPAGNHGVSSGRIEIIAVYQREVK